MPDLVARLSHLYSTLTTRLTLQERLLSLSGKLDLVLTQVELRSSNAPAPVTSGKKKTKKRGTAKREPTKYIEGESTVSANLCASLDSHAGYRESLGWGLLYTAYSSWTNNRTMISQLVT